MEDLQIGDKVLAADGAYSKVYSFGHYDPKAETKYVQVDTIAKQEPLEISSDHLIYVRHGTAKKLVPASGLKVGDYLMDGLDSFKIISLKTTQRQGAFSPLTLSGSLIVNGYEVSCYVTRGWIKYYVSAGYLFYLQHFGTLPLRAYCSLKNCDQETYNATTGFNAYVQFWFGMEQWLVSGKAITHIGATVIGLYILSKAKAKKNAQGAAVDVIKSKFG